MESVTFSINLLGRLRLTLKRKGSKKFVCMCVHACMHVCVFYLGVRETCSFVLGL
jgi:hypothetical protein